MADVTKVKITDPRHTYAMGISSGMARLVELLDEVPRALQQTPGFALAHATIKAEAATYRAETVSHNLGALARAGVNIADFKTVGFDPTTAELICEFYEPDLFEGSDPAR